MDLGCPSHWLSIIDSYPLPVDWANAASTAAVGSNHHSHGSEGEARCVRDHCSCVMDDSFGIQVDPSSKEAADNCCSLDCASRACHCCTVASTVADDGVASGCTCSIVGDQGTYRCSAVVGAAGREACHH